MKKECRDFALGKCHFGDKCKFAHTCSPCKQFARFGTCDFGNTCKFAHESRTGTHAPPPAAPKSISELLKHPIDPNLPDEAREITRRLTQDPDDEAVIRALYQTVWFASLAKCRASFHHVVIPLLQLCTRSSFVRSPWRDEVQWLFTCLHEPNLSANARPAFQAQVLFTLEDLMKRGELQEPPGVFRASKTSSLTSNDMAMAVIDFFGEIVSRFSKDTGHAFYSVDLTEVLHEAVNKYAPTALAKVEKMERTIGKHTWQQTKERIPRPAIQFTTRPLDGGPGSLCHTGPRHDNDFVNFARISILPTTAELASDAAEYLPENRPGAFHHLVQDAEACAEEILADFERLEDARLLDLHFRLLRQDFVLPLKNSLRIMHTSGKPRMLRNSPLMVTAVIPTPNDRNVSHAAVGFRIEFKSPFPSKAEWANKHRKWFNVGGLVALESNRQIIVLAKIVSRQGLDPKANDDNKSYSICVSSLTSEEQLLLVDLSVGKCHNLQVRHVLDEFFAYHPVLAALQNSNELPFAGLLTGSKTAVCRRPAYIASNQTFDLRCLRHRLLDGSEEDALKRFSFNGDELAAYANQLRVDTDQLQAIVRTFQSEVSLIQGPPGTGKSYCGALLVHILLNSFRSTIGPILCLCTTNHALDQFVLDVLDDSSGLGKKVSLVRLGARSKNSRLEPYGLFQQLGAIKTAGGKTSRGSRSCADDYHAFKSSKQSIEALNSAKFDWSHVRDYVRNHMPKFFAVIEPVTDAEEEEHGYRKPKQKGKPDPLFAWVDKGKFQQDHKSYICSKMTTWTLNNLAFDRLNTVQRKRLVDSICTKLLNEQLDEFNTVHSNAVKAQEAEQLSLLRKVNLVAATTSKAADVQHLIRSLKPKVIIVEESGEVFEAHTLAAMGKDTEHLILIGDHQQLRPKPQHYDFATASGRKIDLDVSMFERLFKEDRVPRTVLNDQRRMRPEIADFTRLTYPGLRDAERVKQYPHVLGVRENICFFDHDHAEDGDCGKEDGSATKSNLFEAQLVARFALYLLQQNYAANAIAIIVPYVGQLSKVRDELRKLRLDQYVEINEQDQRELDILGIDGDTEVNPVTVATVTVSDTIRLATVDNFQGEEADVILFSTVRNNVRKLIGFLNDDSRVNVALSRARHGMYVFGNMSLLESKSGLWKRVVGLARSKGLVSDTLALQCKNHVDRTTLVKCADDFRFVPDGGCNLLCTARLECGHACPSMCHPNGHRHIKCKEDCSRRCVRGHSCKLVCRDPCKCKEPVPEQRLPCGHDSVGLTCGVMDRLDSVSCRKMVKTLLRQCGHSVEHPCGQETPSCRVSCSFEMACGHKCQIQHEECEKNGNQHQCTKPCPLSQSCSHPCAKNCGHLGPCPDCTNPCLTKCLHSECKKKCSEPCALCIAPKCLWECEHHQCQLPCGVPCERPLCNEPCLKKLSCNHDCPSLCGEVCPLPRLGCLVCAEDKYKNAVVDFIESRTLAELQAGERIITLSCGHSFTVESLDGTMDMDQFYADNLPKPIARSSIKYRACPNCRALVTARRYTRLFKRAEAERLSARFQTMVRKRTDEFYATAMGIASIEQDEAHDRALQMGKLATRVGKFLQKTSDPMRVAHESSTLEAFALMRIDTGWEATLRLIGWVCEWKQSGAAEGVAYLVDDLLAKETSETVSIRTVQLPLRALGAWSCDTEARTLMQAFVTKFPSPQSADGKAFKLEMETMLEATSKEFQRKLLQIVGADLNGPGWNGNGHVMQCPNGHMYLIGNCGGAMERSSCPDCGAVIGGANHALADGNTRAE
ncbi:hypothetical protein BASA81_011001 [Batrachochytrium salamandrivorans]|nr:hypothetical protein BASA81_011001 [Batrachochytrium salamandrivorans]